jgi:serpin B
MARFSSSKSPEIGIANRLYIEDSLTVEPDFAKVAPMESADFIHSAEPARGKINAWVSDRTKTRIPELIAPNVLDDKTRFVIVNAIYFKGEWATRFDATRTKPETFHGAADVQAPMMHATLPAALGKHGDAQVLDLAYRAKDGPETSMTVILPDAGHSLGEIEAAYEKEGIAPFVSSTSNQSKVDLWLPKMKMSTELELGKMLGQMGMPLAFSNDADFTGITRTEPTKISNVIHKAFVDVNEEGTEAAAATAIVGVEATAIEMPATFHADHPFLFFVRDRATGVILFAGRCASPV